MPWTARQLHIELAEYYSGYRGVTAPTNRYTESLWAKIEQTESDEKRRRGR